MRMEASASLKQTMTHLFDAVRFSDHANELEESARNVEGDLEAALNRLDAQSEELSNLLAAMKVEKEPAIKELAEQVESFLATAKEQAKAKLQKGAKQLLEDVRAAVASEKDKAVKSLEAYFASDPLPIIENVIQVRLADGVYEARSKYECEGGVKYDFRLAAQNSRVFHQQFTLSQLGYELRVPVRFSRALLSKTRTPGFERLDQYILADAEASGGRLRANFEKPGNGAKIKMVTSGTDQDGFVSLEYTDQVQSVSVMNDPALIVHVDMGTVKKAAGELVAELNDLSKKKVALLKLSTDGEQNLGEVSSRAVLQKVIGVMGPAYRSSIKRITSGASKGGGEELDMDYVRERLKVLGGELSKNMTQALGITAVA